MQSEFARDLADEDHPIQLAMIDRPGRPLKIRLQPQILIEGNYRSWKDVRWNLECETPEEAYALRDTLRLFFNALVAAGPDAVTVVLKALVPPSEEDLA